MAEVAYAEGSVQPQKRSKLAWNISDTLVLIKRSLLHIIKSPDQLMSVIFQPIMFTLLFRYIFGGAIQTEGTTYVNYLMAGIIVQSAALGSTYTSLGVATDMQRGIIDRFKSLPMLSSAVLFGHTVADLVRNILSTVVMILVGLAVGFRPHASFVDWVIVFGILLLFTFALSWLSAVMGLLAKTVEAVQWIGFVLVFPLTFASSAFVPTDSMPAGLRAFAENQPVTHVINAIRALLDGKPTGDHIWLSIVWCVGILIVFVPLASYLFRRHTAK